MKRARTKQSGGVEAVTGLILEVFRFNGALLESGDELVRDLGLTSARWQVLGAIAMSPSPLPAAHIARNKGLSRQAVQRLANEMEKHGLVRFVENPHHQRAKYVVLTERGESAFTAAMARQRKWAERLVEGVSTARLEDAARLMRELGEKLEKG